MQGFYLYANGKDYFFPTSQKRKSSKLAAEICRCIAKPGYHVEDRDVNTVLTAMRPATLKVKNLTNGRWCFIHGNGWGVSGNDIVIITITTRETGEEESI